MNRTSKACTCLSIALALVTFALGMPAARASDGAAASHPAEGPLSLEQCLLIALERSPQLVSSRQDVVGAGASLTRARSPYYPQLSLVAEERIGSGGFGTGEAEDTERTERLEVAASQTLWERGLKERVDESEAQLAAAEWGYASAVQSLLEQVASDYYGVLAADRLVEVQEAGVDSAGRHLREVQARIEVGVSAEVDEFTAQDDLARAELALVDARRNARVARARLKTTMGVSPTRTFELVEPPAPAAPALPTLQEALTTAEQNRPDVLRATAAVAAAGSALAQAQIRRGPVTGISATYDWGYDDWERRDPSWDAALRLSWPLLDGHATEADVRASQAALNRSQAQLQGVLNETGFEIESVLAEVQRSKERVRATAASVAAARARLRATEGRYQQGVAILLEVTDARAALTDALASEVEAQYDYRTALVALERALGTLSPPDAPAR